MKHPNFNYDLEQIKTYYSDLKSYSEKAEYLNGLGLTIIEHPRLYGDLFERYGAQGTVDAILYNLYSATMPFTATKLNFEDWKKIQREKERFEFKHKKKSILDWIDVELNNLSPELKHTTPTNKKPQNPKFGFNTPLSIQQIETLYNCLKTSYIENTTELEHFKSAFTPQTLPPDFKKINWIRNVNELVYLIDTIENEKDEEIPKKWQTAVDLFTNKGNTLRYNTLANTNTQIKTNLQNPNKKPIEEIISKTLQTM